MFAGSKQGYLHKESKMENGMKKQKNIAPSTEKVAKVKGLISLAFIFLLLVIIIMLPITYGWIFSTFFTDISGVNIGITESQGLIMQLDGNVASNIDINSYLGDAFNEFSLREASSVNGEDLFIRDLSGYYNGIDDIYQNANVARDPSNDEIMKFRKADDSDYNKTFIYFEFTLLAVDNDRYLIFNLPDCYIDGKNPNASSAIRVSLHLHDDEKEITHIVGKRAEYVGNYETKAIKNIDSNTQVGFESNQEVKTFEELSGYTADVFDSTKTLFYLKKDKPAQVTVRIWLEGGDPNCVDSISSSRLDLSLNFDSITKELG